MRAPGHSRGDEAGIFCQVDGSLVFSDDLPTMADGWDVIAPRIVFHEYSHAVQQELGMVLNTPQSASTRRIELQATCWSAMLLRTLEGLSVTERLRQNLADEAASMTDEDHGTPQSLRRWTAIGLNATTIGQCDTSKAPDAWVA